MFLSYILFELLDVEHGSPISHKHVKCNSLGLALAIDPTYPQGEFSTLQFPNTTLYKPQNEIYELSESGSVSGLHHVTYVTCKITLNFPDNVSNMTYWHLF